MNGHLAACETLIKLGANIELANLSEKSLLQYAIESQCQEVICLFSALENQRAKYSLYMTQTSTLNNDINYSNIALCIAPKKVEKSTNSKKQSTLMNSVVTRNKKDEEFNSKPPAKRCRTAVENKKTVTLII